MWLTKICVMTRGLLDIVTKRATAIKLIPNKLFKKKIKIIKESARRGAKSSIRQRRNAAQIMWFLYRRNNAGISPREITELCEIFMRKICPVWLKIAPFQPFDPCFQAWSAVTAISSRPRPFFPFFSLVLNASCHKKVRVCCGVKKICCRPCAICLPPLYESSLTQLVDMID